MRIEHDLFQRPNPVALTIEARPTPGDYVREGLGATMPMWRVQTEGYTEGTGQLVGVVSRDRGFADSPDVEWISSGVNSKNSRAVAIGRHGNFLHWGFAASPTYMTDEAKLVFVNAVHYIAKFAGRAPIARKRPGTAMRSSVTDALAAMSVEGHRATVALYEQLAQDIAARKAAILARVGAGEAVTERDQRSLDRQPPKTPSRFARIRRHVPKEDWEALQGNEAEIRAYFAARLPYLCPEGWYKLAVDEELRSIGIPNDDIALLETSIAALADAAKAPQARRILERYTDESFASATDWRDWFAQNRERLFFTESGGYRWLVDSTGGTGDPVHRSVEVGAAEPADASPPPQNQVLETSERTPLAAAMAVEARAGGGLDVVVTVSIHDGWHAYASVSDASPSRAVELDLELPKGLRCAGGWRRPVGVPDPHDPSTTTLSGTVEFRAALEGSAAKAAEIACTMHFQVCDEESCHPPSSERLTARLDAAALR